jgi:two-component system, sensor histidine kinase YesM
MNMRKTRLRSRLILGFAVVIVPLLIILLINNWYSISVVRNQVAASNQNLVTMYMDQIDRRLSETEKYLQKTSVLDMDLRSLSSYPNDSEEAFYAKVNTFITLNEDISYYPDTDVIFAYGVGPKEVIYAAQPHVGYGEKELIKAYIEQLMDHPDASPRLITNWMVSSLNGEYALIRISDTGEGSYIGAWVNLSRLLKPFHLLNMGDNGQALIADSDGLILAHDASFALAEEISSRELKEALGKTGQLYKLVEFGKVESATMLISRHSQAADIHLAVLLPMDSLLEKLPAFQRLIYVTPAIAIIILLIFLFYLQRAIALPVHRLMKGMHKIRSGNLGARLEPSHLVEFNDINETFNSMAEEIEHLKIDIYEEKFKTQRAELRHLQAQIHPHFFMNCLNLIYNLAQVKNTALVQTLALYLVRHFQFTIRTNLSTVSLREELDHIRNYLNIQKVRFPKALEFRIDMDPEAEAFAVPPLTVQPFVENAMHHGFSYKDDEPFTIKVTARKTRSSDSPLECIVVRIEDNGKGFQPDILEKLRSGEYFRNEVDRHIGIWNVHHRCELFYRTDAMMEFDNRPEGGAIVTLKLPGTDQLHRKGDKDVSGTDR